MTAMMILITMNHDTGISHMQYSAENQYISTASATLIPLHRYILLMFTAFSIYTHHRHRFLYSFVCLPLTLFKAGEKTGSLKENMEITDIKSELPCNNGLQRIIYSTCQINLISFPCTVKRNCKLPCHVNKTVKACVHKNF